jgi:hypothetical protein
MDCPRCESAGRKPKTGVIDVIGPNGVKMRICPICYDEIVEEQRGIEYFTACYENEED